MKNLFSALMFLLVSVTIISCKKTDNIDGCTDPTAFNYNAAANHDDGTCIAKVYGCMDSTAYNYNPAANVDDASCTYAGCMDTASINFNPNATVDDGSCEYRGSAVFYVTAGGYGGVYLYGPMETYSGYDITDIYCGAPGCATFSDVPTIPGGMSYQYTHIEGTDAYYGTIIIYPNKCTQRNITL